MIPFLFDKYSISLTRYDSSLYDSGLTKCPVSIDEIK